MRTRKSGWSLYWIVADGEEDCFVVARNSRSAERVEIEYSGFEVGDVSAIRVKSIPPSTLVAWRRHRVSEKKPLELPWYADEWVLKRLGARFRNRNDVEETLIDSVVYSRDGEGPAAPREIGAKFLEKFRADPAFQRFGRHDKFTQSQLQLFTLLGACVARCHEIEFLIAHSFVFGGLAAANQGSGETVHEVVERWKRMTLGQMVRLIEGTYEIDPMVNMALAGFLQMRNQLIHGITMDEQYDIDDPWGRGELVGFLALFEVGSRVLREAFRGSFYASIDIGNRMWASDEAKKDYTPTRRQRRLMALFADIFKPKDRGRNEGASSASAT